MYGPGNPPRAVKHNAASSVMHGPFTCRMIWLERGGNIPVEENTRVQRHVDIFHALRLALYPVSLALTFGASNQEKEGRKNKGSRSCFCDSSSIGVPVERMARTSPSLFAFPVTKTT